MDEDELGAEIQAQVDEWSSNSNEAITIELIRPDGSISASFNPAFTYPIFGDEEAIFGYQDLNIILSFAAHNLRPQLSITYSKKFKAQGEVQATDIKAAFEDFLPRDALTDKPRDEALQDLNAADFRPPGSKVHEYSKGGSKFELWSASLADKDARKLLENIQTLVPMFIEGGTILELDEESATRRWKVFFLYEKARFYSLVGYGTSYRVFALPDRRTGSQSSLDLKLFSSNSRNIEEFLPSLSPASKNTSPLDFPSRERLSQFLIFPPFQGMGHGQELYNGMYRQLVSPSNIREFTVEDPNEDFDDLRDYCDLVNLRANNPEFSALRINTKVPADKLKADQHIPTGLIVDEKAREHVRSQTKIMPRQFERLVEMHTLSFIPTSHRSRNRITRKERSSNEHDKAYYFWRLYVKHRLFVHNIDTLSQIEREERIEKLEAALDSVQEGYAALLEKVESRASDGPGAGHSSLGAVPVSRAGKRKVIQDDEDEEADVEEADVEEADGEVNGQKKGVGRGKTKPRLTFWALRSLPAMPAISDRTTSACRDILPSSNDTAMHLFTLRLSLRYVQAPASLLFNTRMRRLSNLPPHFFPAGAIDRINSTQIFFRSYRSHSHSKLLVSCRLRQSHPPLSSPPLHHNGICETGRPDASEEDRALLRHILCSLYSWWHHWYCTCSCCPLCLWCN
nr:histone acetyltransferase type b catalytic subunit [Quercus suber]